MLKEALDPSGGGVACSRELPASQVLEEHAASCCWAVLLLICRGSFEDRETLISQVYTEGQGNDTAAKVLTLEARKAQLKRPGLPPGWYCSVGVVMGRGGLQFM